MLGLIVLRLIVLRLLIANRLVGTRALPVRPASLLIISVRRLAGLRLGLIPFPVRRARRAVVSLFRLLAPPGIGLILIWIRRRLGLFAAGTLLFSPLSSLSLAVGGFGLSRLRILTRILVAVIAFSLLGTTITLLRLLAGCGRIFTRPV